MVFSPSRESLATIEYERVGLASGHSGIPHAKTLPIFNPSVITVVSRARARYVRMLIAQMR